MLTFTTPEKPDLKPSKGVTPLQLVAAMNRWRDQYNPLRGLTLAKAERLLDAGQRGEFADLQWAYQKIERRNPVHRACIVRRLSAILAMDWEIKSTADDDLPEGVSPSLRDAQEEYLTAAYNRIDNLKDAIRHLAMAEFRGFAHLWKHDQDMDGLPEHLECLDQWSFVRDGRYGPWAFNKAGESTDFNRLREFTLNRSEWVIREVALPINEIALLTFIRKSLALRDWDAFVEIYGVPSWVITGPPDLPEADRAYFEEAAVKIAEGGAGFLPNGSTATSATAGQSTQPFEPHLRYHDTELVLAATAGKLTMLAESGSGTLAGNAHQDTFEMIAEAEAAEISEVFQRDLDKAILGAAFPGAPILAYFDICSPSDKDAQDAVKIIQGLSSSGFQVEPEDVEERTGFSVEVKESTPQLGLGRFGDMALQNRAGDHKLGNGDPNPSTIYSATSRDLRPIIRRLRDIEQMTDAKSQEEALKAMLSAYGDLAREVLSNSESAKEWEKLLGTSLVNGLMK